MSQRSTLPTTSRRCRRSQLRVSASAMIKKRLPTVRLLIHGLGGKQRQPSESDPSKFNQHCATHLNTAPVHMALVRQYDDRKARISTSLPYTRVKAIPELGLPHLHREHSGGSMSISTTNSSASPSERLGRADSIERTLFCD